MDNRKEFTSTVDGKTIELVAVGVTNEIRGDSNKIYSKAFYKAIEEGIPLVIEVEELLRKKGLLNDEADAKAREDIIRELKDCEVKLRSAKINKRRMTKQEGREIALNIKQLRNKLMNLSRGKSELLNNTAENTAENTRLNYCVYRCTLKKDTLENYWRSYEDFLGDMASPVYADAVTNFIGLMTGIDSGAEQKLYENQWLIRMGFMNEAGQLINEKGQLVDEKGRLINKDGRYINEAGEFVDAFGNLLTDAGELLVKDGWDE